jgi:phospholipid/cholesterol/gamma-HCH transport system permease protein
VRGLLRALGGAVFAALREVGGLALVTGRAALAVPRLDRRELRRSLAHFGYDSLPLGLAVAAFTGGILVLLANVNVQRFGARSILGWAAGYAVLREFGPLLTALVLTGRVGARNAAELAAMTLGGQMEGLRGVGVDPFALLVAPRVAASALAVGALGLVCSFAAIVSAAAFGQLIIGVEAPMFFRSFAALLGWRDLATALAKTMAFGLTLSLVSTRCGLAAEGGARAVGRAAALAVVESSAALTFVDWLLTLLLTRALS